MKKLKQWLRSPAATIVAFALAAGLLLFSSVGGTRAAVNFVSQYYQAEMQVSDIGVSLLENGNIISYRDYDSWEIGTDTRSGRWEEATGKLLENMPLTKKDDGTEVVELNKPYEEMLAVQNTGTIAQYVRVSIYRYWINAEDAESDNPTKLTDLDPSLIDLHVLTDNGWILDESSTTKERTVLYFGQRLDRGDKSAPFADTLTIDGTIASFCDAETGEDGSVTYTYNGKTFCLEVKVDAVQDHNAADAVLSAWGRNVYVDEEAGTLSLV